MFVERFQHPVGMESSTCSVFDEFILASSVDSERADLCTPSTGWWLYKSTQGAQVRCWYKSTRGVGRVVVQIYIPKIIIYQSDQPQLVNWRVIKTSVDNQTV